MEAVASPSGTQETPLQEAGLWLGYLPSRAVNKGQCV